ncbi:tail fiber domain-containing protein [candidate division KSB1 bacterium]|nr:tail fiber domain-containing protein [candidate division KSB1 bacterium]MBL7093640.1 tail fiber domain-containing protein [candidate division KSB1 bacterium]
MYSAVSGNVGIGTTTPNSAFKLHIRDDVNHAGIYLDKNGEAGAIRKADDALLINASMTTTPRAIHFNKHGTVDATTMTIDPNGNVGIGTTTPSNPLEMASGAHVTTGGVWTNASSRDYKENIRDLTGEEAMSALHDLKPSRYNYKVDKEEDYVGFIAEDVPDLVANKDRKGLSSMDIVAVLTKVVQEQQKRIEELEAKINK